MTEDCRLIITFSLSQRDSGTVSCVARNKGGEASFSVQLKVLERETIERPRFIERLPATLTVKAGAEISLSITAGKLLHRVIFIRKI